MEKCKKESKKELSDIQTLILKILSGDNKTTIPDLARKPGLSARKISNELKALREDFHILKREGGRKNGYWIIDEFQYGHENEMYNVGVSLKEVECL